MASNSATAITQQSVKAYVDAPTTAQDLDFQGDPGGALSIDLDPETLDIAGGTGITNIRGSGNTPTVTLDDTAVSAGNYGSTTAHVHITDAQGRITGATASLLVHHLPYKVIVVL